MKVKLPVEVERFAQEYFAAENLAEKTYKGMSFRKVDQKKLALSCKALLETGVVENMNQLALDLRSFKGGSSPATHALRLVTFAKRAGIVYSYKARKTTVGGFNLKSALNHSFHKALRSGIPLTVIQTETAEVLKDHTHRVQVTAVATRLQDLIRETGFTPEQVAKIASGL